MQTNERSTSKEAGPTSEGDRTKCEDDGATSAASEDRNIPLGRSCVITFSRDDKFIISSLKNNVRIWNAVTGEIHRTLRGHDEWVNALSISPDNQTLASASSDKTIRFWNLMTGEEKQTIEGLEGVVQLLVFSTNGKFLASGSDDSMIHLWRVSARTVEETQGIELDAPFLAVGFSADSNLLISITAPRTAQVWKIAKNGALHEDYHIDTGAYGGLRAHEAVISPDGRFIATTDFSAAFVKVWSISKIMEGLDREGHSRYIERMTFSPSGDLLASHDKGEAICVWCSTTGRCLKRFDYQLEVKNLIFSQDSKLLAAISYCSEVRIWNIGTGLEQRHPRWIESDYREDTNFVKLSPDLRYFAFSTSGNTIGTWDLVLDKAKLPETGHNDVLTEICFSDSGRLLASASFDTTVCVWDSDELKWKLEGHRATIRGLSFSSDEKLLASASEDGATRVWDMETGSLLQVLETRDTDDSDGLDKNKKRKRLYAVHYKIRIALNSNLLASADIYGTIRVWDWISGKKQARLYVERSISRIDFSADGTTLCTNRGDFELGAISTLQTHDSISLPGLEIHEEWLYCNGQDTLWLPDEYLGSFMGSQSKWTTHGNLLAVGRSDGQVSIFKIEDSL